MKFLTIFSLLAFTHCAPCFANSCSTEAQIETKNLSSEVPKSLKGAKITVTAADGKTYEMSAEQFKVVPRKQQQVVTKVTRTCNTATPAPAPKTVITRKNRLSAGLGYGPTGRLDRSVSPQTVTVEPDFSALGMLQYQRLVTERLSLGLQGLSNKTGIINIGYDF